MNLTHLQTFYKVAQLGGFSAAADALLVSKGMISRHVQALEASLNTRLFHRTTRKVTLTEAGQRLFDKAAEIERLSLNATREIKDLTQERSGSLKFTAPHELGRTICRDVIPDFAKAFPNVEISLKFGAEESDIEFGTYDIALRAVDHLPDNVIARSFGTTRNILVASTDYLAGRMVTQPRDLFSHAAILSNHQPSWNNWFLQSAQTGETIEIAMGGQISAADYAPQKELACQGLGIANLPFQQVAPLIREGHLVHILPNWSCPRHRVHLLYAKQRHTPEKIRGFNDLLFKWKQDHPDYFVET
ncbi:LysR family transcriptional regulator [Terasakiella pusilla]|uniref:LysR family transcriptional regulator n=1 Tax=Terasakiella pusilla TaxID=64973 RepID=UPI003AA97767